MENKIPDTFIQLNVYISSLKNVMYIVICSLKRTSFRSNVQATQQTNISVKMIDIKDYVCDFFNLKRSGNGL